MNFSVLCRTFLIFCKVTFALVSRAPQSDYSEPPIWNKDCHGAPRNGFTRDQLRGKWVWKVSVGDRGCDLGVTLKEGFSSDGKASSFIYIFARRYIFWFRVLLSFYMPFPLTNGYILDRDANDMLP